MGTITHPPSIICCHKVLVIAVEAAEEEAVAIEAVAVSAEAGFEVAGEASWAKSPVGFARVRTRNGTVRNAMLRRMFTCFSSLYILL